MTLPNTTRVTFIAHASTEAVRRAWFPDDEPLDSYGTAAAREQFHAGRPAARCSPVRRCHQTAAGLGYGVNSDDTLRVWNLGVWTGRRLADVTAEAPEEVAQWMADPDFAPSGGESLNQLIERVAAWLDGLSPTHGVPRIVAITDPALIRAAMVHAIGGWTPAFWRLDVGPLDCVDLSGREGVWSVRAMRPLREAAESRPLAR